MTASRRLIWLIVSTAFFMEILDGTVIATALPQIAHSFGVNPVDLSIGMTSYLVTVAVFLPASGWVADRFGTRTVFGCAVAAFTLASILCAISTNVPQFTAARIFQGIAGSMMVPVGRLAVLRTTAKQDLVRALTFIVWPALIAPVVGPPLGGFIATYLTWQWIFILNVPLGIAGLLLIRIYLPNTPPEGARPFDVVGFLISGAALSALMIGVEALSRPGGLPTGLLLLAASVALGFALVPHLRRHPHPLMNLDVFRIASFRVVMTGGTLARCAINAMPFLLPLLFQIGFGLTAFQSGLLYMASMLGNLGTKSIITTAMRLYGFRTVLIVNGLLAALVVAACAPLSASTPVALTVLVMVLHGITRSLQFSSLSSLSFADVPQAQFGSANTLFSISQQMAQGLGIAVGALALHMAAALHAGPEGSYQLRDFAISFGLAAAMQLLAVWSYSTLRPDAGAAASGHKMGPPGTRS